MKRLSKKHLEERHAWADMLDEAEDRGIPQSDRQLCSDGGFCCLGVAANWGLTQRAAAGFYEYSLNSTTEEFSGYVDFDISEFIMLNDDVDLSFEDIADVIRRTCDRPEESPLEAAQAIGLLSSWEASEDDE